ncbi:thioredoxin family protein [Faecalicoccus acidiformans]|uniref:thioredoxin family protein n=1 Tax=Faecalicoccus acidiformans TaxID=915173 RepID=UPI0023533D5D|nr:thioredoxin family protein [Faecalicoccus acidiformans]
MITIHTREEFDRAIQDSNISVMLFTTKWCGDCMFIKPFMPEVEKEFENFTFYEIDRDEMMDLAQELEIMGIPSFVSFRNGKEISRFVSSLRKTRQEIEDYLNQNNSLGE